MGHPKLGALSWAGSVDDKSKDPLIYSGVQGGDERLLTVTPETTVQAHSGVPRDGPECALGPFAPVRSLYVYGHSLTIPVSLVPVSSIPPTTVSSGGVELIPIGLGIDSRSVSQSKILNSIPPTTVSSGGVELIPIGLGIDSRSVSQSTILNIQKKGRRCRRRIRKALRREKNLEGAEGPENQNYFECKKCRCGGLGGVVREESHCKGCSKGLHFF